MYGTFPPATILLPADTSVPPGPNNKGALVCVNSMESSDFRYSGFRGTNDVFRTWSLSHWLHSQPVWYKVSFLADLYFERGTRHGSL